MHHLSRIVLVLLVGLPGLGSAQTTDAPMAASAEAPPPPLVRAPPEPAPPPIRGEIIPRQMPPGKDSPGRFYPRILLGSAVGSVTAAGGGILGFLLGEELAENCNLFDDACHDPSPIYASTMIGVGSFSSLTVYGLSSLLDGRGTLLGTLLGGFVATGLSVPLIFWIESYGAILIMPVMAAIGAVVGYEIYDAPEDPSPGQALSRNGDIQFMPVLGVTPAGGVLGGLMGRF